MIKFINKPLGITPKQLQVNNKLLNYYHTGTLDVLACGKMLFIHKKFRFLEKYLKRLKKVYTFTLIVGFTTDSYDILGLITKTSSGFTLARELRKALKLSLLTTTQIPPEISYRNLDTKNKVKNFLQGGKLKKLKPVKAKLYNFKVLEYKKENKDSLINSFYAQINQVDGNFRQKQVLQSYKQNYNNLPPKFSVYKIQVKVSGGFYIRGLVRDLGKICNAPMVCMHINREGFGI